METHKTGHFTNFSVNFVYCYRFKHLSFNTEVKGGSKQNEVLLH
jgi:hypothetical protein